MALPSPAILVPGIQASSLWDVYPVEPERVWQLGVRSTKDSHRIIQHPEALESDGDALELAQPVVIRAWSQVRAAYAEFIDELRDGLEQSNDARGREVPVFPFVYDWRQPLDLIEARLGRFIDEVIQRTLLIEHYHKDQKYRSSPTVSLVGHSMGGLVVMGHIANATADARRRIAKIMTIASPFGGSVEGIANMILGPREGVSRRPSKREAARLTPSVYHLLPSYDDAVRKRSTKRPVSIFRPENWQPSVPKYIERVLRKNRLATKPSEVEAAAKRVFRSLLDRAESHRKRLEAFEPPEEEWADWLFVSGIGTPTLQTAWLEDESRRSSFEFDRGDETEPTSTGDDTVPYRGSMPPFIKYDEPNSDWAERIVCVEAGDAGLFSELDDRIMMAVGGFHALIMNIDQVQRLAIGHLAAQPGQKGRVRRGSVRLRPAIGRSESIAWSPIKGIERR